MVHYNKVGLLVVRDQQILLCRKSRGTDLLILPGGCFELGETAEECLQREVAEELGPVSVEQVEYVATYRDKAASEPTKNVQIELYRGQLAGEPTPNSEIAELVWFGKDGDRTKLSPILTKKIVPDLIRRRILDW